MPPSHAGRGAVGPSEQHTGDKAPRRVRHDCATRGYARSPPPYLAFPIALCCCAVAKVMRHPEPHPPPPAGAPLPLLRWSKRAKHDFVESRRQGTRLIVSSLQGLPVRQRTLIVASGVGYYGPDCGGRELIESAANGAGFIAEVRPCACVMCARACVWERVCQCVIVVAASRVCVASSWH